MSDLTSRTVGSGHRVTNVLRSLWPAEASKYHLQANTRQAELEGFQFAFYARLTAIVIVSSWLFWIVPWPRDLYYGAYAFGFFLLGYIPY